MPDEMNAPVVADIELVLPLVFHYTEKQVAEVWEQQLIPNRIVDGQRVAKEDDAVAYLERIVGR